MSFKDFNNPKTLDSYQLDASRKEIVKRYQQGESTYILCWDYSE